MQIRKRIEIYSTKADLGSIVAQIKSKRRVNQMLLKSRAGEEPKDRMEMEEIDATFEEEASLHEQEISELFHTLALSPILTINQYRTFCMLGRELIESHTHYDDYIGFTPRAIGRGFALEYLGGELDNAKKNEHLNYRNKGFPFLLLVEKPFETEAQKICAKYSSQ